MTKQDEIREGIIVRLMAADEIMTVSEATDFWARWKAELAKNPEHFGDCTKEPQTCNRCLIEDYYRQADEILSYLHSQGVVIKAKRKLPLVDGKFEDFSLCDHPYNFHEGYHQVQQDMKKAGYIAVEPLIMAPSECVAR